MFKFLQTIKSIKKLKSVEPDKKWLRNLRLRFSRQAEPVSAKPAFFRARLATTFIALILILGLGSGGLVNSAQAALPEDTLYPIKLLSERIQNILAISSEKKADLALKFAQKRLIEAEKQSEKNNFKERDIAKTLRRAENHVAEAEALLAKLSEANKGDSKKFKKLEKVVERLNQVAKHKKQLAKKFSRQLPAMAQVLKANAFTIEEQDDRIIITFSTNNGTSTIEKPKHEFASSSPKFHRGSKRIIELLKDGAGKSGKVPKGLRKAPGIKKKLKNLFEFSNNQGSNEEEPENEDEEEDGDEEENSDDADAGENEEEESDDEDTDEDEEENSENEESDSEDEESGDEENEEENQDPNDDTATSTQQ